MALFGKKKACPGCGKKIDEDAVACPKCGYKFGGGSDVLGAIVDFAGGFLGGFINGYNSTRNNDDD
jgi:hypothetical protein